MCSFKKLMAISFLFAATFFLETGASYSYARSEEVHGVAITAMDAPLSATIGEKVNVELVVGNEQSAGVTTILTVICHETGQQIGRETISLDGLASRRIVYVWNTKGLKPGEYRIHAEAEKIPGETDVDDNVRHLRITLTR